MHVYKSCLMKQMPQTDIFKNTTNSDFTLRKSNKRVKSTVAMPDEKNVTSLCSAVRKYLTSSPQTSMEKW